MRSSTLFSLASVGAIASAYSIPANLQTIYNNHKTGSCKTTLKSGFNDGFSSDGKTFAYCGDLTGAIYLHSSGNGGQYDNMDIDCDGANRLGGACSNDPSGQGQTAFKDSVATYGISDLDTNIHPYVVFGNSDASPEFDPQQYGMEPLSVMAVVCGGKLFYGIWGDTNGGTSTGEASISMGNLCFPNEGLTGDNGHDGKDVLYIGFTGSKAVPGKNGANWKASNTAAFQSSIKALGDSLVAGLK